MGLIDRILTDPGVRARREEFAWRQDYRSEQADRREMRRERQRELDRQQRADAAAVTQRQRENAALVKQYQDQERAHFGQPRTDFIGGNNQNRKPLRVTHHSAPLPLAYITHPESPDKTVVFGPGFMRSRNGSLMSNPEWAQQARETLEVWTKVKSRYATTLAKLRDDAWWTQLATAAGLTHSTVTDEPWQGDYATGTRKVTTVTVPTIGKVQVAEDGLRITIQLDVHVPPKRWAAATDVLRAGFKGVGMDAGNLRVTETASGAPVLVFGDLDPFENLSQLEHTFDIDKGRSLLGITSSGKEAWVVWSGSSGMVVGGVPGSGKTASMLPVFASLAGHAELHVFDGKASYDLDPLKHIARTYDRTAAVDAPLETLQTVFGLIEKRATVLMKHFGHANFWNAPAAKREALGLYPIIIVLDEAQTWTNPEGMDSDEKKLVASVTRYMRELVLKGRSSGIFTVITTQQPDTKTIPSNLRNNAGRKLAFRVSTPEQAITILGALPPGAPSPTEIPMTARGRFVMEADGQGIVMGQAGYVSPEELDIKLRSQAPVPDQAQVAAQLLGESYTPPAAEPEAPAAPVPSPAPAESPTEPAAGAGTSPVAGMTDEERKEAVRQEAIRMGLIPPDEQPTGEAPTPAEGGRTPRNPLGDAPVAEQPDTDNEPSTPTAPKPPRKPRRGFE